jgi:putative ABC transport system permease protein
MQEIIKLQIWQLVAAYLFILLLMFMVRLRGIPREKEIVIATFRMTLQLVLTGYILVYLFDNPHPLLTIITAGLMLTFAINNIMKRVKTPLSQKIKKVIALSMGAGTLASLLYFLFIVIAISPWYEPRYFIPIAGMIIGNSMTGITLGVSRLVDGMHTQKALVEGALMLGATPKMAAKPIVDGAFDSAIIPTINSMVGMGIVFLPGMMTGQILSGVSPLTAIEYQIAIMLGIVGSVSLSVLLFVELGYKTFFNQDQQLEL